MDFAHESESEQPDVDEGALFAFPEHGETRRSCRLQRTGRTAAEDRTAAGSGRR